MRAFIFILALVGAVSASGQTQWADWSQQPERAAFVAEFGWNYQPEGKTEGLQVIAPGPIDQFNPFAIGLEPSADKPVQFATPDGGVIQIHSLNRLDVLYNRWVANDKKGL